MIVPYYNVRTELYSTLQNNVILAQDVVGDGRNTGKNLAAAILIGREIHVSNNGSRKDKKHELWGWLLFVISALFFIASSIRNADMIGLLGGVFFLLACVAFLASYIGVRKG